MIRTLRSRPGFALAGGVLSAALVLTTGVMGAQSAGAAGPRVAPAAATNKLTVSRTSVPVHVNLDYNGKTTGIKSGTKVQLQQLWKGSWINVTDRSSTVSTAGTYTITDSFMSTGTKTMRTDAGGVYSNTVKITVT